MRTCDIVMKGGITSGAVYPLAITTLSERFVFKNIGGTSAGAIAAAATAAAEYRRQTQNSIEGFYKLKQLPNELGQERKQGKKKGSRLFFFFQPHAQTRRIFSILTSVISHKKNKNRVIAFLLALPRRYPLWALLGALPLLSLCFVSLLRMGNGWLTWLWPALGLPIAGVMALLVAGARFLRDVVTEIPRHHYGLCSGLSDRHAPTVVNAPEALTEWLTTYLNDTAGLSPDGPPLTFGNLWNTPENITDTQKRLVNLEMMTTNLTHGRPYRLPFRNDPEVHENVYYFRPDEFLQLFPAQVVQWLVDHPRACNGDLQHKILRDKRKSMGFHPLPAPDNLPVVVATRMSLSFPLLLTAVPLYMVDYSTSSGTDHEQLERCWFSDGGICSNFPLHFFDTALPQRPTFSIDITAKPKGTPDEELLPSMAEDNGKRILEKWKRFRSIPGKQNASVESQPSLFTFLWAIICTMQNWTDTTQGRLPGYRDRIVTIPIASDEGGINLEMPRQRITRLSERGAKAANLLIQHFDVPAKEETMNWENHRWIRLRSFLSSLEKSLHQLATACDEPENNDIGYKQWLIALHKKNSKQPSYRMSKRQIATAIKTLEKLQEIHDLWSMNPAAKGAPRPRPVLRPRPHT